MTSADHLPFASTDAIDRLAALHLRIAQRADELARSQGGGGDRHTDLELWLEAEGEVLLTEAVQRIATPSSEL